MRTKKKTIVYILVAIVSILVVFLGIIIFINKKIIDHSISLEEIKANYYLSDMEVVKRYLINAEGKEILSKSYATEVLSLLEEDETYSFVKIQSRPVRYYIFCFPKEEEYSPDEPVYYVFEINNLTKGQNKDTYIAQGNAIVVTPLETYSEMVNTDIIICVDKKDNITKLASDNDYEFSDECDYWEEWIHFFTCLADFEYSYDNYNRFSKIALCSPDGNQGEQFALSYEYLDKNSICTLNMISKKDKSGIRINALYDFDGGQEGRRIDKHYISSDGVVENDDTYYYSYDEAGRISGKEHTHFDLLKMDYVPLYAGHLQRDGQEYYPYEEHWEYKYSAGNAYVSTYGITYRTELGEDKVIIREFYNENNEMIDYVEE